jgi:hypothetical protein
MRVPLGGLKASVAQHFGNRKRVSPRVGQPGAGGVSEVVKSRVVDSGVPASTRKPSLDFRQVDPSPGRVC